MEHDRYFKLMEEFEDSQKQLLESIKELKQKCDAIIESDEVRHGAKYKYFNLRDKLNSVEMDVIEID